LAAGDRVIIEGLQKVQPGMSVKAIEASDAGASPAAAGSAQ
jgi:membrane fusion protein (multidrug efflux system)